MTLPLKPLFAAALALPLTLGAPLATAQTASTIQVGLNASDPDAYAPDFAVWYETVMPGKGLDITVPQGFSLTIDGERWTPSWRAPDTPQVLKATLRRGSTTQSEINIFVLEPHANKDSKGWINGYRIGTFPRNPPEGFIRLDGPEDREHQLSPHFKLGQFLCKQQPDHWPKYVLVTHDNIRRVEALLTALQEDGITDAETFFMMSGFRTPFYNTAIGSARYSRHMYGDASDIYLDVSPKDGVMDDLNGDGRITKADANWLYDYAERLYNANPDLPKGGIGTYGSNAVRGPFIHVDGRGTKARWGR